MLDDAFIDSFIEEVNLSCSSKILKTESNNVFRISNPTYSIIISNKPCTIPSESGIFILICENKV